MIDAHDPPDGNFFYHHFSFYSNPALGLKNSMMQHLLGQVTGTLGHRELRTSKRVIIILLHVTVGHNPSIPSHYAHFSNRVRMNLFLSRCRRDLGLPRIKGTSSTTKPSITKVSVLKGKYRYFVRVTTSPSAAAVTQRYS